MWCGRFEDMCVYLCAGGALADPNRPRGQQKCPQMGGLGLGKKKDAALARLTAKPSEEIHHAYVINMISVPKIKGLTLLNKNKLLYYQSLVAFLEVKLTLMNGHSPGIGNGSYIGQ